MDLTIAKAGAEVVAFRTAESSAARPSPASTAVDLSRQPIGIHAEGLTFRAMIGQQTAWQDLCDRALEKNIFLEPAFALALIQHSPSLCRPTFLLIWEESSETSFSRLIGLLPFFSPRPFLPGILRGFITEQVKLGTPLLDRDRGAEAMDAMLEWLREAQPKASALRLSMLDADGPVCKLLAARCATTGRSSLRVGEHRRAVLLPVQDRVTNVMPFVHSKKRKEIGRQRRRLSERGVRTYKSASAPDEIAQATERFLALEHNGWKGQRGTALLARPALATFTRTMTRLMGHEGKCRIDAIEIDGVAVAMGIVLTVGERAHFWKTAFHEGFSALSPGVQFALELTERQLDDPKITLTDSCAVPNHPMIDRLWRDRMSVTDVLVELDPNGTAARFAWACRRERLAHDLRAMLKTVYLRMRRGLKLR